MKPKPPDPIKQLEGEVLKLRLPEVKPLPEKVMRDEPGIIKAVPYYLLRYGENLELLAKYIPDKKLSMLIVAFAKGLNYLAKRYKIKNA